MSAAADDVPPPHHHHPTSSTSRGSPQQLLSRHSPQPHITYAHNAHITNVKLSVCGQWIKSHDDGGQRKKGHSNFFRTSHKDYHKADEVLSTLPTTWVNMTEIVWVS